MSGDPHASPSAQGGERHAIQRVRHELKRRALTVAAVEAPTPRVRRVHFTGPALEGFVSLSPDDHVKIFLPSPDGGAVMRDFTPRAFDPSGPTLTIDFALHPRGVASDWARRAAPGDTLEIGGPRGSMVVPDDFDAYVLVGDESALPAIGRRVEGLRAGVPVATFVVIADAAERQAFSTRAAWQGIWVTRGEPSEGDASALCAALERFTLPPGDVFVWIAGEATLAQQVRAHFVARGHPKPWIRASGYWKRGAAGVHVEIGDAL